MPPPGWRLLMTAKAIECVMGAVLLYLKEISALEISYISGMTFVASFTVRISEGDEAFSFSLLTNMLESIAWLRDRSYFDSDEYISSIEIPLFAEFPALRRAFDGIDVPRMLVLRLSTTMFAYHSIPLFFTAHCWDYVLTGIRNEKQAGLRLGLLITALLGVNERLWIDLSSRGDTADDSHSSFSGEHILGTCQNIELLFEFYESGEGRRKYLEILNKLHNIYMYVL